MGRPLRKAPQGPIGCRVVFAQYPHCPSDGRNAEEVPDLQQGIFDEVRDLTDTLDNGNRIILARGLGEGVPGVFVVKKMPRAGTCGLQNLNEVFALLEIEEEKLTGVHTASAVFKDADHLYLFMELSTGGDLFNHVGEVVDDQALRAWATKLLQVLQVLHRSGRVHGDVCLENLVVDDKSSTLKIIDCAQMIHVHAPGDTHKEACVPRNRVTGRTLLRPPETVNPPAGASSSAKKRDIYQAACTIFALATSAYPFATMREALSPAPREELPTGGCAASVRKLRLYRPSASPELQDFLGRLLAPNPDMRLTATEALAHPWIAGPAA
jgi:serine/threonine protein kinase